MNKRNYLGLSLSSALVGLMPLLGSMLSGCGDDGGGADLTDASVPSGSVIPSMPSSSMTVPTSPSTSNMPPTSPPVTAMPSASMSGAGGTGGTVDPGTGGSGGAPAAGGTCDVSSLIAFQRSDTDQVWDDNDFSDVVVEGTCPVLVNATWPHEAGWQDADPSEANQEQVHFTLDSSYSGDLTGKQLNLTIELAEHQLGPAATAAGYVVSIVSVSSYTRTVVVQPEAPDASALDGGVGDGGVVLADAAVALDAGISLDAAVGDEVSLDASISDGGSLTDGGADASSVDPGPMTVTETGYSEAESAPEDRLVLRRAGDRATLTFALPNKTAEVDSYDPTRVIKINIRIYNLFSAPEPTGDVVDAGSPELETDAGSDAGMSIDLDGGVSSEEPAVGADAAVSDPAEPPPVQELPVAPATPARAYDYVSARFAITSFTVSDVTGL